jgi:hypothetical protein
MSRFSEATIFVNGVRLTDAQSMTVRVALNNLISEMRSEGLGDDQIGRDIASGYIARGGEVLGLIHGE